MSRTRIKICGIRDEDAATAAADAGADAIGFMFVRTSPRAIDPGAAYEIMSLMPPMVSSVGVFADPTLDEFSDIEEVCPTIYSQLHGHEDVSLIRSCGPDVIKAIRFDEATIARHLALWDEVEEVSAILIDGSPGGEGLAFDWSLLTPHLENISKPIILAGGLNADNVAHTIREVRPFGVDVSSGVEREKGVKDPALIEAFCLAVQAADRE